MIPYTFLVLEKCKFNVFVQMMITRRIARKHVEYAQYDVSIVKLKGGGIGLKDTESKLGASVSFSLQSQIVSPIWQSTRNTKVEGERELSGCQRLGPTMAEEERPSNQFFDVSERIT